MKTLPLSQGLVTVVDDDVYEWASKVKWTADVNPNVIYAYRKASRKTVRLHREILCAAPGQEVDHLNGDGLCNLRSNLRLTDHAGNAKAHQTLRKDKSSSFRGVRKCRKGKPWEANIKSNQRPFYLGRFDTEEQAARAYDTAAKRMFGDLAQLNFP